MVLCMIIEKYQMLAQISGPTVTSITPQHIHEVSGALVGSDVIGDRAQHAVELLLKVVRQQIVWTMWATDNIMALLLSCAIRMCMQIQSVGR